MESQETKKITVTRDTPSLSAEELKAASQSFERKVEPVNICWGD